MDNFALIVHPRDEVDVRNNYPVTRYIPRPLVSGMVRFLPPFTASAITGPAPLSAGPQGWFIACPLTAAQITKLPEQQVLRKIVRAGRIAEKLGAGILGLGGWTAAVGNGGAVVAGNLKIPVTTGNSYTAAAALEAVRLAAWAAGFDPGEANVAVVGATGLMGNVCTQLLALESRNLVLIDVDEAALNRIAGQVLYNTGLVVKISTDLTKSLRDAEIVFIDTGFAGGLLNPRVFKPGSVICDVRGLGRAFTEPVKYRDDVFWIEGGLIEPPGDICFNINLNLPCGMVYAWMAEAMILSLARKNKGYSPGREITVKQVEDINRLAKKYGFKVKGHYGPGGVQLALKNETG